MITKLPLFQSRNFKRIRILGIQNGLAGLILVVSVAIIYRSWILPYPPVGYVAFMHYFSVSLDVLGIIFVVYFTIIGITKNGIYTGFERGKYFVFVMHFTGTSKLAGSEDRSGIFFEPSKEI